MEHKGLHSGLNSGVGRPYSNSWVPWSLPLSEVKERQPDGDRIGMVKISFLERKILNVLFLAAINFGIASRSSNSTISSIEAQRVCDYLKMLFLKLVEQGPEPWFVHVKAADFCLFYASLAGKTTWGIGGTPKAQLGKWHSRK